MSEMDSYVARTTGLKALSKLWWQKPMKIYSLGNLSVQGNNIKMNLK
jgi:hypothetical protein